jgi:hypothetical protein
MKQGWIVLLVMLALAAVALDWLMVVPRWVTVTGMAVLAVIVGLGIWRNRRAVASCRSDAARERPPHPNNLQG